MKRARPIALVVLFIPIMFLLLMRFYVVRSEGYPSWEAVRNMLVRNGEIVITLPDEVKVLAARCDHHASDVSIDGQVVTTKIGYSWSTIVVDVEIKGERQSLQFVSQKLNDWNRIRFNPIHRSDPFSGFTKIENGVEKSHSDVTR